MTNYDVVIKLIGPIDPVGKTETDAIRMSNLVCHIDLAFKLLEDIAYVSNNHTRDEHSMKVMGKKALNFLKTLPTEFEQITEA